jgi:hypothetical protein
MSGMFSAFSAQRKVLYADGLSTETKVRMDAPAKKRPRSFRIHRCFSCQSDQRSARRAVVVI